MDYSMLEKQLVSLSGGVTFDMTVLANAAALIYDSLDRINWAGFYLMRKNELCLAPFCGKPACTEIQIGKGVCGTCAKTLETHRVADVHKFPGHIACDSASKSEIVIPITVNGALYGVLDIDSPEYDRFSDEDEKGLERFVRALEIILGNITDE